MRGRDGTYGCNDAMKEDYTVLLCIHRGKNVWDMSTEEEGETA